MTSTFTETCRVGGGVGGGKSFAENKEGGEIGGVRREEKEVV